MIIVDEVEKAELLKELAELRVMASEHDQLVSTLVSLHHVMIGILLVIAIVACFWIWKS